MGVQKPRALTSDFKPNVFPGIGINAGSKATLLNTFFNFLTKGFLRSTSSKQMVLVMSYYIGTGHVLLL